MITIIGVKFRCNAKVYYFSPGENTFERGMQVIVETARGLEMGNVVFGNRKVEDEEVIQPLRSVIRMVTEQDLEAMTKNKSKEKEAYAICKQKIQEHQLEMKLVDVEYTFDNSKILFYFTADGRIDFRELVKDLASIFKMRIELRQIGVRDETKIKGGIGICGRCLCCCTYLNDFVPVSIKMAKEQNLSLNPTKISGACGRLMCCLKNEEETYEYLNSKLPSVGDVVIHRGDGMRGTVHSVNILRQLVKVVVNLDGDDVEIREYPVDELNCRGRKKKDRDGEEMEVEDPELCTETCPVAAQAHNNRENKESHRRDKRENREKREQKDKKDNGERKELPSRREKKDQQENREKKEKTDHANRHENREGKEKR